MPQPITRRDALTKLAAVGASLPLLGAAARAHAAPAPNPAGKARFHLGVASYSLRGMPLDNALQAIRRVGLDRISVNRLHLPWENSPPGWTAQLAKFKPAGVEVSCVGVLTFRNDETQMRTALEYVRTMGAPLFSCNPSLDSLPLLERFVKEYDVRAAIHNHGPEDATWPSPHEVAKAIQGLDRRIGLCIDVGHTYRAGADPAETIRLYRDRLYDIHLKDTAVPVGTKKDVPLEIGRGVMDQQGILQALIDVGYDQTVWFEFEKSPEDPLPGLAESVGYTRGMLKAMGAT